MASIRLTVAYDGSPFSGWAVQPGMRTVEGELKTALETILRTDVALKVAGRTDAGVHAWGQVASFELDGELPSDLVHRANGVLPPEIVVQSAHVATPGFDARRDARSRTYCYRMLVGARNPFERGRSLLWQQPLDREFLERCAALLPGNHDFTAFTPTETEHVRFVREIFRAEWRRVEAPVLGELLEFWIEADAFMHSMVRILVGTMLEVAAGKRTVESFEALLAGAPRQAAGDTAAAHGLYLAGVRYGS